MKKIKEKTLQIPFKKIVLVLLIFNLSFIAIILKARQWLPPEVPLLYGLPKGEQTLTSQLTLILPSLTAMAILVINSLFIVATKDDFLQKIFVALIIATSLLSAIATLRIILLVGSF